MLHVFLATALLLAAADDVPCPIKLVNITQYGLSARITGANHADYAVDRIAIYLTYDDALNQEHEQRFTVRTMVQPDQGVTFTTPVLEAYPKWSTVDASFTCRQLSD